MDKHIPVTVTTDPLKAEGTQPKHGKPYIWPTWISGHIAGDKHCWWASWFRTHYKYVKLDPDKDMTAWRATHASMVEAEANRLRAEGWVVTVEDQNKFGVKGQAAIVGGCPDVIAQDAGMPVALVADCKSGQRRESDYWQVFIYGMLNTMERARLHRYEVTGRIVYQDGVREVPPSDLREPQRRKAVVRAIELVAASDQPARVPSAGECSRCDILCCPDRTDAEAEAVATDEF